MGLLSYESTCGEASEKSILDISPVLRVWILFQRSVGGQSWSRKQSDETKRKMSNVFDRIRYFLLCGTLLGVLPFKSTLSITLQLPWYSPNAKTTQGINNSCWSLLYRESVRLYRAGAGCVCAMWIREEHLRLCCIALTAQQLSVRRR